MKAKRHFDLSAATLHILAMAFMLCDHLWATVIPGNQWLTCLGRLAYPIFAFMIFWQIRKAGPYGKKVCASCGACG